jgi:F0F1-type ATP synthase assembly protein I
MSEPQKKDSERSPLRSAGMLLAIPSLLIAGPLVGFFLGGALDRWLKTAPWMLLACIVLGFVASGREIAVILRRVQQEQEQEEADKRRRP